MTLKRILVPFPGTEADDCLAETIVTIGHEDGPDFTVLHVRSSGFEARQIAGWGIEGGVYADAAEAMTARAAEREKDARKHYDRLVARLKDEGLSAVEIEMTVAEGYPPDILTQVGGAYDLLVVPRPIAGADGGTEELVNAALFYTGRPVLIAPPEPPEKIGAKVLLAWNRSPQAARALAGSMSVVRNADAVLIYHVETGAKRGPSPEAIRDYLHAHAVESTIKTEPPDHRSIGEQVMDQAHEFGADLVVMGAYSHSRLRELILGGVTRAMLTETDVPVLMTH
jgi:nucleotide-binding universal stress UspA family protein